MNCVRNATTIQLTCYMQCSACNYLPDNYRNNTTADGCQTYSEAVEDVAAAVQTEFLAWVTVHLHPADLHVARRDHLKLVVPSQQHDNRS